MPVQQSTEVSDHQASSRNDLGQDASPSKVVVPILSMAAPTPSVPPISSSQSSKKDGGDAEKKEEKEKAQDRFCVGTNAYQIDNGEWIPSIDQFAGARRKFTDYDALLSKMIPFLTKIGKEEKVFQKIRNLSGKDKENCQKNMIDNELTLVSEKLIDVNKASDKQFAKINNLLCSLYILWLEILKNDGDVQGNYNQMKEHVRLGIIEVFNGDSRGEKLKDFEDSIFANMKQGKTEGMKAFVNKIKTYIENKQKSQQPSGRTIQTFHVQNGNNAQNGLRPSANKVFMAALVAGSCYLAYRKWQGKEVIPSFVWSCVDKLVRSKKSA